MFCNRSWKTTSAGLTMLITSVVALVMALRSEHADQTVVTTAIGGIVGGLGLLVARDNDKSSEDVGIK